MCDAESWSECDNEDDTATSAAKGAKSAAMAVPHAHLEHRRLPGARRGDDRKELTFARVRAEYSTPLVVSVNPALHIQTK